MILEIKGAGESGADTSRLDFQQDWLEIVDDMLDDFVVRKAKISKLEENLRGKVLSRKHLGVRVQKIFSEKEVARFASILSGHLEMFNLMLALTSQYDADPKA